MPKLHNIATNRHAEDAEDDDEAMEISVDLIDEGVYLGNAASAGAERIIKELNITHILTVDLVPLCHRYSTSALNVQFKYVHLSDIPKEDLISNLPTTSEYIKDVVSNKGNVLVHCYYGVSRSAAVVIAYIMEKYDITYEDAYVYVKSKRRLVGPNVGFVAQLKLFGHMRYKLNPEDPRYKQFRLKMAGQKLKEVKILPQLFADLIKPDPGLVRERPDPIVYRCKKCRRVVASQNNIIPHLPKDIKVAMVKKGIRPPPSTLTGLHCAENGRILIEKLKNLATQILEDKDSPGCSAGSEEGSSQLDGYHEHVMVDSSIAARDSPDVCRLMWFVEPMVWMENVSKEQHGKLHCPKCQSKIGSFSWVCGCKCPCGQKVAPAFYLVPSKVEWSNIVQNVQVTL